LTTCAYCGEATGLPFRCRHCHSLFCQKCRLPEAHHCCHLDLVRSQDKEQKTAILFFLQSLNSKNLEVREQAARILGELKDPRAIKPLVELLNTTENEELQRAVVGALEKMGWVPEDETEKSHYLIVKGKWEEVTRLGPLAIFPLLRALQNPHWHVRAAAAQALGKLGDTRAIGPLRHALQDRDSAVQRTVGKALAKLTNHPKKNLIDVYSL